MWFSKFILFQFDNTFHFFFQSTANMGMHMQQTKAGKLNDNILRFSFEFISESKFYCKFLSFQMTFRQYYHRMTQRQHLLRICWNNSVRMWSKKLKTTVMRLWPIQPPIWTVTDRSNVRRHPQVGGHRTIWKMNRCLKSRISTKPIEKWISTFKWMRSKFKRQFGKFKHKIYCITLKMMILNTFVLLNKQRWKNIVSWFSSSLSITFYLFIWVFLNISRSFIAGQWTVKSHHSPAQFWRAMLHRRHRLTVRHSA